MKLENQINNEINVKENNFLKTTLGKTIDNSIDIGLKAILPDLIEKQIIDIKDALIKNGLKSAIDTAIDSAIDFGKSAVGIFTGNFENMTQVRTAVADGGIIDTVSDVLDKVIDKTYESGYINKSINKLIKNGKDLLLENITKNITSELEEQTSAVEKIERYLNNWKEYYNNKDFEGMTKEYTKIQNQIDKVIPIENILKETRKVEILHNLIKNNGRKFEITNQEQQLVKNLSI